MDILAIVTSPEGLALGGTVGGGIVAFVLRQLWAMNANLASIKTLLEARSFCPLSEKKGSKQ